MKKTEIKEMIRSAIATRDYCELQFRYHAEPLYCFPIAAGDRLFLGTEEKDFILDGFFIRRFRDVVRAKRIKDDKFVEIVRGEKLLEELKVPPVDLGDWQNVFSSLKDMGHNIIIEKESLDAQESEYAIGKIVQVLHSKVRFRHFDADGVWRDEPYDIPYTDITSVTFSSRYVNIFSKYV